ncbi:MAG: T9SS type A sorting domain-containing protein [Gemmatimonadetes bacterium]|nr:T9SS type A sorting domain-containing protein [Gemmatimonadota bacterium]
MSRHCLILALTFSLLSLPVCVAATPTVLSTIDPLLNDLTAGAAAYEVDMEREFGTMPIPELAYLGTGDAPALDVLLDANLDLLMAKGIEWVDFALVEGGGVIWFNSPTLAGLVHAGFDYDSQYDHDDELVVDEAMAKKRYTLATDAAPLIIQKAHARGLKVSFNVEALAHVINRAEGSGIGGDSETTLAVAEDLPAPTLEQLGTFIDEVIALGPDAVSAEAYSSEYDHMIADRLSNAGIDYWHTGPGLGSVWVGYYYSPYPTVPGDLLTYTYLHTYDGQLAMTNGDIYARARGRSTPVQTSLVVGAYNPHPCDRSLNEFDLYSETRPEDENWIDNEIPRRPDGTVVENCATDFWRNLALYGTLTQDPDLILISADLQPSVAAAMDVDLPGRISARLGEHTYRPPPLPVANIIIDVPSFTDDDGMDTEEYLELISLHVIPLVNDGLEAAGLQTVLTQNTPWTEGTVSLTYIITAGGNETNGDDGDMGAPYWTTAQDLPADLASLLDTAVHGGPVFLHPVLGIPSTTRWKTIRSRFGMPDVFAFKNEELAGTEEQTSLVSSRVVDADLEEVAAASGRPTKVPITPDAGQVMGFTVKLPAFLDDGLGQAANIVGSSEVAADMIIADGPMLAHTIDDMGNVTATDQHTVAYLVGDNSDRFLWTINQLHSEAFTFILTRAIAEAMSATPPLAAPAAVQMRGGRQLVALAYDRTDLSFNLPVTIGDPVSIRIYDHRSEMVSSETISYAGTLTRALGKRSLLVAQPGPVPTAVTEDLSTAVPEAFTLSQNYPNPFNSSTTIHFDLPHRGEVLLQIYDLAGQQVSTLLREPRQAGTHTLQWHGRDDDDRALASGMYLYRLETGDGQAVTRKLMLLR